MEGHLYVFMLCCAWASHSSAVKPCKREPMQLIAPIQVYPIAAEGCVCIAFPMASYISALGGLLQIMD